MSVTFVTDDEPGIRRLGTKRFRYVREATRSEVRATKEIARIRARGAAGVDRRVDLRGPERAHPGDGARRQGPQAVPVPRAVPQSARSAQVQPARALRQRPGRAARPGWIATCATPRCSRDRVLAAVVSLLERTYVRVGNEEYRADNRSFGLTTLRCAHAELDGTELRLRFTGKGGKRFDVSCCDARLVRVVRRCRELPGQPLFQYLDDAGEPSPVTSTDVNEYLRESTSIDATAKTFRTWARACSRPKSS